MTKLHDHCILAAGAFLQLRQSEAHLPHHTPQAVGAEADKAEYACRACCLHKCDWRCRIGRAGRRSPRRPCARGTPLWCCLVTVYLWMAK